MSDNLPPAHALPLPMSLRLPSRESRVPDLPPAPTPQAGSGRTVGSCDEGIQVNQEPRSTAHAEDTPQAWAHRRRPPPDSVPRSSPGDPLGR
eukprot:1178935-Pyramimonas_sp.AAC.1